MATTKKFRFEHLSVFIIAILLVVSVIINISSAYFTDSASASNSTQLVFGTIAVRAKPNDQQNYASQYNISADEVAIKADLYKLIVLENEQDTITQPFYLRVSLEFYNGNVNPDTSGDYVTFSIAGTSDVTSAHYGAQLYQAAQDFDSTNWATGVDGKLYYNTALSLPQSSSKIYIPVKIHFTNAFGYENFNSPYVEFRIDIIQSANNGYTGWNGEKPASNWPVVS